MEAKAHEYEPSQRRFSQFLGRVALASLEIASITIVTEVVAEAIDHPLPLPIAVAAATAAYVGIHSKNHGL